MTTACSDVQKSQIKNLLKFFAPRMISPPRCWFALQCISYLDKDVHLSHYLMIWFLTRVLHDERVLSRSRMTFGNNPAFANHFKIARIFWCRRTTAIVKDLAEQCNFPFSKCFNFRFIILEKILNDCKIFFVKSAQKFLFLQPYQK